MSEPKLAGSKRSREKYSRLICLGCGERRIRCELPSEVDIPEPGELRTVQTPCYRCKRLGIPCVIRRTIIGRPGLSKHATPACSSGDLERRGRESLLIHRPQSAETVLIIRAVDTLRRQRVEEEWFRHLATLIGRTEALDLSIKTMVSACAFARKEPNLTARDCYEVLSLALNAVQSDIKKSHGEPSDDMLASTALLAPFEGVIAAHGIPTHLHVDGLAAILVARPATYPVTQLAREILDYYACEAAIVAFVRGRPSCFEGVNRAYFVNNRLGCSDSDRAQLKAFGNELFIRTPRLVMLVRSLRLQPSPPKHLLFTALSLLSSLLELQDFQAEERLLRSIEVHHTPLCQSLRFFRVQDFEALACYWQTRLSLLRLESRLHDLAIQAGSRDESGPNVRPAFGPRTDEMFRLVKNIVMCSEYVGDLPIRRHLHLFAYAMVAVWGVTTDFNHDLAGRQLPDLLLQTMNRALTAQPELTLEDMNTAADIFVGGQPTGRFAELYGL